MKGEKWPLRIAAILLSLCLIFAGIQRGEQDVVWRKAANLCMECIGIG